MTREEAIKWLIKPTVTSTEVSPTKAKELEAYNMAIEALKNEETLKTQLANCHKEILRLLDFNDITESPNDVVESKDDVIEVTRCKDCRWYDNGYGDVCHNPRYGDGHANYSPPYVDGEYFCKDGERKEP